MRIVSLLPSATDIVVALGAGSELVGVSHSCSGNWENVPKLTSTWIDTTASSATIDDQVSEADRPLYELDIDLLAALAPDVVVSQSLCDVCAVPSGDVVEAIDALPVKPQLVDLAPSRLSDVPDCFVAVGQAIGRSPTARDLTQRWHEVFNDYRGRFAGSNLKVAFLDWLDPPFAAGHWMPDMLEWLGLESALGQAGKPSFAVSWDEIRAATPDLVVAACCGFGVQRTQADAADGAFRIVSLDGHELFNRPSPALMASLVCLSDAIDEHLR